MSASLRHDPVIRKVEKRALLLTGAFALAGLVFVSTEFSLGAAMGGILSLLGFRLLKKVVPRLVSLEGYKARMRIVVYHYLWMSFIFGVMASALYFKVVSAIGLVLGLSVVVVNLLMMPFVELLKKEAEV
jgi:uncharacterized membrane protein